MQYPQVREQMHVLQHYQHYMNLVQNEGMKSLSLQRPLLQAVILDAQGTPVPGAEVIVVWDTGQDHFFTGLKPEFGLGYGDFTMSAGVSYTLQITGSSQWVTGLVAEACESDGGVKYWGTWLLTFVQQSVP